MTQLSTPRPGPSLHQPGLLNSPPNVLGDVPLGPLDGRYRTTVAPLAQHLSEAALNQRRVHVEVEWLIHLTENQAVPGLRKLTPEEITYLRAIASDFNAESVAELAETERVTLHDVKAVEYYVKKRMEGHSLADLGEIVHLFCTSEDINNLSYALMVRDAVALVWLPAAWALHEDITDLAHELRDLPMLARTHGQPATPTTLGKELAVLAHRLGRQLRRIDKTEFLGKINGATGTFSAHIAGAPDTDWIEISRTFVEHLGLTWNPLTTQIESHDWQAELYSDVARFNRVLHNLCTDVWTYISMGYFIQVRGQGSVGSSTMPHKVNPIRFENAEANLEVSNGLFGVLEQTLVTSRLQRDLTDSSMQRNIGIAFGHSLLAIDNARKGLAGLDADPAALARDLDATWEVLGEAVQSVMRVHGLEQPYERLKELTRGRKVDAEVMREFVSGLGLPEDVAQRLIELTPGTYVGVASKLVDQLH
ncbi:adenylosuccinate lyase [Kineosporia mesophila]|uniref:Adenylosuccinate lyase n=1 Tax=Kineosporia mesophila TaxID=566012 RepID=A0ABP6ZL86_9ACTN|nr:adenylosuccinate lyase [Kineosporia mesophila]